MGVSRNFALRIIELEVIKKPISTSATQSINQSTGQSPNQSVSRSVNPSVNQLACSQRINQSIAHSSLPIGSKTKAAADKKSPGTHLSRSLSLNILSSIGCSGSCAVRSSFTRVASMRERWGPACARQLHTTACLKADIKSLESILQGIVGIR